MKKLIYILFICLLFSTFCHAGLLIQSVKRDTGPVCLTGTYAFHWKPTYNDQDRTTACVDDGSSTIIGTQNGGSLTANGLEVDAINEYISWDKSIGDALTVFVYFQVTAVSAPDQIFHTGVYADAANYTHVRLGSSDSSQGRRRSNNAGNNTSDAGLFTRGILQTIGYTFRVDAGNDSAACLNANCGTNPTWVESNNNIPAYNVTPTQIYAGDLPGLTLNVDDVILIEKILIIPSYAAGEISGW